MKHSYLKESQRDVDSKFGKLWSGGVNLEWKKFKKTFFTQLSIMNGWDLENPAVEAERIQVAPLKTASVEELERLEEIHLAKLDVLTEKSELRAAPGSRVGSQNEYALFLNSVRHERVLEAEAYEEKIRKAHSLAQEVYTRWEVEANAQMQRNIRTSKVFYERFSKGPLMLIENFLKVFDFRGAIMHMDEIYLGTDLGGASDLYEAQLMFELSYNDDEDFDVFISRFEEIHRTQSTNDVMKRCYLKRAIIKGNSEQLKDSLKSILLFGGKTYEAFRDQLKSVVFEAAYESKLNENEDDENALVANTASAEEKSKKAKVTEDSRPTCPKCGRIGHIEKFCWKDLVCKSCGKTGHPEDRCRTPKRKLELVKTFDENVKKLSSGKGRN
jgi:hypothetical protein